MQANAPAFQGSTAVNAASLLWQKMWPMIIMLWSIKTTVKIKYTLQCFAGESTERFREQPARSGI